MHDVAIVGGGLAGAMTAFHLARAGRDVVVLERSANPPRRKACGEGLFPGGVRELARAGLGDQLAAVSVALVGVRFHAGPHVAGARLRRDDQPARGVRRDLLDPIVLDLARSAGADVRTGTAVTALRVAQGLAVGVATTTAGAVEARVVVGADGLNSRVRQLAGLDDPRHSGRYGVSMHVCTERPVEPWVRVHFERDHELYLTPVGPNEMNVAVLARKPFMSRFAGHPGGTLGSLFEPHGVFTGGWEQSSAASAAGPFGRRARRAFRGNVVLVGDAAGFFDGITGEGMSLALVSARHCAAAVDAYLAGSGFDALRGYARKRRALERNSELLGRVSLALGRRPALARLSVRNLGMQPATFEKLTAINAGDLGLSVLRPRDVLALAFGL